MGLSNQSNFNYDDPTNFYFCPAMAAMGDGNSIGLSSLTVHQNFKPIDNVVVNNDLNNPTTSTKKGDVDVNDEDANFFALHAGFKLFKKASTTLTLSLYGPMDKFIEADTGDFYEPEYVMYKSRYKRMSFFSSMAHKLNENFALSLGIISGMQSSGRTNLVAYDSGSDEPSSGSVVFNATPSIAPMVSVLYKLNESNAAYLAYQSEMKSNFEHSADGFTPIGSSSVKYDWTLSSMLFYDPAILRLGYQYKISAHSLYGTVERQFWGNYETPKLKIKNEGGVLVSSKDYEEIDVEDITIYKIGYQWQGDSSSWQIGYALRPTPIKKDYAEAGNSIDSDAQILSLGHIHRLRFFEQDFNLAAGLQMHKLDSFSVDKSSGMENGDTGSKIGDGGYEVGGEVYVLSLGISWKL